MRKNIICILIMVFVHQLFAQDLTVKKNDDDAVLKKTQLALKSVIYQSKYIIEAKAIKAWDYYYIKEEDQTYFRGLIKVKKVIRGSNIVAEDTIIIIWKQEYKGEGPDKRVRRNSIAPRLWYIEGKSTSCLFLTTSKFPTEPVPNQWSHFIKTTYIPSSIGYFAACYDTYIGDNPEQISVLVPGLIFNFRSEWYDYLRKFKNINLPKKQKKPGKTD